MVSQPWVGGSFHALGWAAAHTCMEDPRDTSIMMDVSGLMIRDATSRTSGCDIMNLRFSIFRSMFRILTRLSPWDADANKVFLTFRCMTFMIDDGCSRTQDAGLGTRIVQPPSVCCAMGSNCGAHHGWRPHRMSAKAL